MAADYAAPISKIRAHPDFKWNDICGDCRLAAVPSGQQYEFIMVSEWGRLHDAGIQTGRSASNGADMTKLERIRQAFGDYTYSEGCRCCRHEPEHREAAARLAELLNVPAYDDGSGYDFYRFRTGAESKRADLPVAGKEK